jgi:biotin carboxyl carrier protein
MTVEDRSYRVELAKKEGKGLFEAKVNEKPVEFELESVAEAHSPLTLKVAGKTYHVEIDKIDRRLPFTLKVNEALFRAQLKEPVKRIAAPTLALSVTRAEKTRGQVAEEGAVVAPMAGKIVSVKTKKGDTVKTGDVVCILEAMKMENEISAPKAGVVQEVNVSEGAAVNEGDVLIVIK